MRLRASRADISPRRTAPFLDEYAASNPKDWKYVAFLGGPEVVQGNDVAGYVEAVGEGVTEFKKGDKVSAFTRMDGGDR